MAALITIHSPAEKRSSVNCNTLRDAQKRHKTPFRAAVLGFSVTYAALHSQKIPRGIFAVKVELPSPLLPVIFVVLKTGLGYNYN